MRRAVDEALQEGKLYCIDHRVVLPGGTVRIVHEQAEVGRDDSGRPVRMVGTVQDITELKRTEEELRQRVDELERFRKATVQREFRMKELKERVRELEKKVATGGTG